MNLGTLNSIWQNFWIISENFWDIFKSTYVYSMTDEDVFPLIFALLSVKGVQLQSLNSSHKRLYFVLNVLNAWANIQFPIYLLHYILRRKWYWWSHPLSCKENHKVNCEHVTNLFYDVWLDGVSCRSFFASSSSSMYHDVSCTAQYIRKPYWSG